MVTIFYITSLSTLVSLVTLFSIGILINLASITDSCIQKLTVVNHVIVSAYPDCLFLCIQNCSVTDFQQDSVIMPKCSKCGSDTKGHPQPWGPQCSWDGQPVSAKEGEGVDNGLPGSGGDKESPAGTPSGSGGTGSTSPKADAREGGPRSVEGRDTVIAQLQQQLDAAVQEIAEQNRQLEERKKDQTILDLQKKLADLQLVIKQNHQKLQSSPAGSPHTQPAAPGAGSVPAPAAPPVDPSNAAYAAALAAAAGQPVPPAGMAQSCPAPAPAPAAAPVAALGPVFTAMQAAGTTGSPQAVLAANPLTKALIDAAKAASPSTPESSGKSTYLPHKYILKPGLREAKSVEQLTFAEFVHSYMRMIEAMYEAQEPIADRIDFLIRLASEVTHTKWHEVRELYMLFEQEVINGKFTWMSKFEGQIEKMAYSKSNKSSGHHSPGGAHSSHSHQASSSQSGSSQVKGGVTFITCNNWNWRDSGCRFTDETCQYRHYCFTCLKKGFIKDHKAKECFSKGAGATENPRGHPRI